jgi:hypothetical protein
VDEAGAPCIQVNTNPLSFVCTRALTTPLSFVCTRALTTFQYFATGGKSSDEDNVMVGGDKVWLDNCPGCSEQPHVTIKGCGHFLQDGGADQLVEAVVNFIDHNGAHGRARL